ncbi:TPA: hypothetical protein DCE37_17590 [Candidatus Latescibacteria bacterium]|nr:hypothetical protein [Candidatus Latescibacterota bacterium]
MRLRHIGIRRVSNPSTDGLREWIGHLALEAPVADLVYRSARSFQGDVLVAEQEGVVVGVCGWQQDEGMAVLGPVVVREDKRRWGLGTHLVERAVLEMREAGIRTIEATFSEGDPAPDRLYRRHSFRPIGSETDGSNTWTRVERVLKKT